MNASGLFSVVLVCGKLLGVCASRAQHPHHSQSLPMFQKSRHSDHLMWRRPREIFSQPAPPISRSSPKSAMLTNTWFDVVTINCALLPLDPISSQQSPRYRWIDEHHGSKCSFPTNGGVLPSVIAVVHNVHRTWNLMNDVITCSPIPRKWIFLLHSFVLAIISCFATTFLRSLSQHCRRDQPQQDSSPRRNPALPNQEGRSCEITFFQDQHGRLS